jgi:LuxR family maltose regulon positive regulatory protein
MGDLCSAQEALHKAEALVEQESYDYYALWVSLLRVQCWLAEANLSLASEWAARTTFALETWDPARTSEFLMLVHVSLAQQKYAQAVAMLERFREQLDRPADIEKTVEFLALYVVALHCADKREQAADVAARLLTLTEPEGCIRVYLDAGEPMKQVLQSLLEAASTKAEQAQSSPKVPVSFLSKLLLAFEQEEKNLRHPPLGEPTPSGAFPFPQRDSSPPHPFVESLTQREQEVLRLLADGASNQQIADALVIELSTVKKHVSNLLSKLGAESRTQAITRARTLSLL